MADQSERDREKVTALVKRFYGRWFDRELAAEIVKVINEADTLAKKHHSCWCRPRASMTKICPASKRILYQSIYIEFEAHTKTRREVCEAFKVPVPTAIGMWHRGNGIRRTRNDY